VTQQDQSNLTPAKQLTVSS